MSKKTPSIPDPKFAIDDVVVDDGRVGIVIGSALEQNIGPDKAPGPRSWRYLVHPPVEADQALQMSRAVWAREDALSTPDEAKRQIDQAAARAGSGAADAASAGTSGS